MKYGSSERSSDYHILVALGLFSVAILLGCHQVPLKPESPKVSEELVVTPENYAESAMDPSSVPPPSRERVLESYSYLQLSQAALAYKIVADEAMGRVDGAEVVPVFGCELSSGEAKTAEDHLKELIDLKMSREQVSYLRGSKSYLKTRGASECEKTCTCGAILDVVSIVDVRVLSKKEQTMNEEFLLELQSKFSKQGPEATMECARQQKWICKSDLQKFLKSQAKK